jgi:hypothetical protein
MLATTNCFQMVLTNTKTDRFHLLVGSTTNVKDDMITQKQKANK